jgi:hypothetical protein
VSAGSNKRHATEYRPVRWPVPVTCKGHRFEAYHMEELRVLLRLLEKHRWSDAFVYSVKRKP